MGRKPTFWILVGAATFASLMVVVWLVSAAVLEELDSPPAAPVPSEPGSPSVAPLAVPTQAPALVPPTPAIGPRWSSGTPSGSGSASPEASSDVLGGDLSGGPFYETPTPVVMFRSMPLGIAATVPAPPVPAPSSGASGPLEGAVIAVMADPDEGACGTDVGGVGSSWVWLVELDRRVGVCFAQSVGVEGNVRLWVDGGELEMTELTRTLSATPGGVRVLWFDRSRIAGRFYALDWRRDPEFGERIVLAGTEIEIFYELPDALIGALSVEYAETGSAPVYDLEPLRASMASDSFVVGVSGILDSSEKFFLRLSDPFGYEDCSRDSGTLFAPVLSDHKLRFSASFGGYMSLCIASGGRYFADPPYRIEAQLLSGAGSVIYSEVFESGEFDVELSATSVSYGDFGEALVAAINAARSAAGFHPVVRGSGMVAQKHAQRMIDGCYSSHWDERGLKPYMRYALDGGVHASAEVWVGTTSFCVREGPPRIVSSDDILALASEAVARWRLSPAHAAVLFSPDYHVVSHGLAYDSHNWRVVAVFESAFVERTGTAVSHIDSLGRVVSSGRLTESAYAAGYRLEMAEVRYDPGPMPLSLGELARTSFYGRGRLLMIVADRVGSRSIDIVEHFDPYGSRDLPAPADEMEASALFEAAKVPLRFYTAVYEFALVEFSEDGRAFGFVVPVEVGLRHLCPGAGLCGSIPPGVYTITLIGAGPDGRLVEMSSDSVWFGLELPDG